MKLVICAMDMGLSDIYNLGALHTIDAGTVLAAGVMPEMPGTEHALRELKARQWVSLVWQFGDGDLQQQLDDCIRIYGKAPYAGLLDKCANPEEARRLAAVYGIRVDLPITEASECRKGLGFEGFPEYDAMERIRNAVGLGECVLLKLRPGFLDETVMRMVERTDYSIHRMRDQEVLASSDLRNWLAEQDVMTVTLRDALEGTKEHLWCQRR